MTSVNITATNSTSSTSKIIDYQAYTCLGSISVPVSLLTFVILFSDRVLLRKSALIWGLTLGNFMLGLFLLTTGAYRLMMSDELTVKTTFGWCTSVVIFFIYPLAFNIEASFLFLSGVERLLAIKAPHWFWQNWNDKKSWTITLVTLILVVGTLLAGLFLPVTDRTETTKNCGISAMYGTGYLLFLSAFAAIGGASSASLTVFALIAGVRHIKNLPLASGEAGRLRRQLQLTKSMVTVSCVDVALVVIPNILSLLTNMQVEFPTWIRGSNSSYTHGINALVAPFAFTAFNSQFRKAAIKLFRAEKIAGYFTKKFGIMDTVHHIGNPIRHVTAQALGIAMSKKADQNVNGDGCLHTRTRAQ